MWWWVSAALVVAATGCSRQESTAPQMPSCALGRATNITVQTSDGLTLHAELTGAGKGAAGALLLHMVPPQNDRSNYPRVFIEDLVGAGFSVLNLDRRGAGSSEGDPEAAYQGQHGRLDALAGVEELTHGPCAAPAERVVLIGASNGTTTALDYAVASQPPAALVYLSPGTYTENQNSFADHEAVLAAIPTYFAYPDSESDWIKSIARYDRGEWTFKRYNDGDHGTKLFESNPESRRQIVDFLSAELAAR